MEELSKTKDGHWKFGENVLEPGDPVQLLLEGAWINGRMEEDPDRGDYFVAGNGEAYMVGLEGTIARVPQPLSPEATLEEAFSELLISAGQAVAALKIIYQRHPELLQRRSSIQSRLVDAINRVRSLRGEVLPAS